MILIAPGIFGVLWDQDESLASKLLDGFYDVKSTQAPELIIGDNEPYHARKPLGYSLVEHAAKQNVEMALIEIRQDLIREEEGQRWAADIIFKVVGGLLDHRPAV